MSQWYDFLLQKDDNGDTSIDYEKLINLGLAGASGYGLVDSLTGGDSSFFQSGQTAPTGYQGTVPKYTATRTRLEQDPNAEAGTGKRYFSDVAFTPTEQTNFAEGGIATVPKGYYLGGSTDGMADKVPASIDGGQEARLSDGEFVIPADVVSHLGNGNSSAGAEVLYAMMERIRKARTGNPEQGKQINPNNMIPK